MQLKNVLAPAVLASAMVTASANSGSIGDPIVVMDQIGDGAINFAMSSSSSQFDLSDATIGSATIDNFTIGQPAAGGQNPVRLTSVDAVVKGLADFGGFDMITSWSVQIYSSPSVAAKTTVGDVYSLSTPTPTSLSSGMFPDGAELLTIDIDAVLQPGEYWISVVMENPQGFVGIQHSTVGDGGCVLAVSTLKSLVPLADPAAYRIDGVVVPAPGVMGALLCGGLARRRWRRA